MCSAWLGADSAVNCKSDRRREFCFLDKVDSPPPEPRRRTEPLASHGQWPMAHGPWPHLRSRMHASRTHPQSSCRGSAREALATRPRVSRAATRSAQAAASPDHLPTRGDGSLKQMSKEKDAPAPRSHSPTTSSCFDPSLSALFARATSQRPRHGCAPRPVKPCAAL